MGYFAIGRWNANTLRGKLWKSGIANAPVISSHSKMQPNDALRRLLKYARPIDVLKELKDELRESMRRVGTTREQQRLELVLKDFDAILQRKIARRTLLRYANLLIGIINLWAGGKVQEAMEARVHLHRKLVAANPKKDPRYEEIFDYANMLFAHRNNEAEKMRKWLRDNRRGDIVIRGQKVSVKDANDTSLSFMIEQTQLISYNQALREANRQSKKFSAREFDEKETRLQDAFRKYRKRKARGKRDTVSLTKG